MKKIFVLVIGLSLLANGCALTSDQSLDNVPETSSMTGEDKPDMSQWKTYENKALNFKISYPDGYTITESPKDLPVPEDQPDAFKNTVLYISNQDSVSDKVGSTYGQIYIMKLRSSIRAEYSKQISPSLMEMTKVPTDGDLGQYYMFNYFTASANDSSRVYMLSNHEISGPGDLLNQPSDILIARVQSGYNGNIIPETTVPDWIARTMNFIK